MPATSRKVCKYCKKKFTPCRSDQIYCSTDCRVCASRQETDKNKSLLKSLSSTGFFNYIQYQCRRAGTVEVVPTKLELLVELHSLWSYNNKANGFKKEKAYEISHVLPVSGVVGKIGSLHPCNLVVQPARFNRSHSNNYFGFGHGINAYRLKSEYLLDEYSKKDEILALVFKRIGIPTLKQFKKISKPTTLARIKELEWFEKKVCLLDKSINLYEMDLEQLRVLKSEITGVSAWNADWTPYDADVVLLHELDRLSVYRPALSDVQTWWAANITLSFDEDDAFLDEAINRIQPVLVGAAFDAVSVSESCQRAQQAENTRREHKRLVNRHIQQLVESGVIESERDPDIEGWCSYRYVWKHSGKLFDMNSALEVSIPNAPMYLHADHPELKEWDLYCLLDHDVDFECPF